MALLFHDKITITPTSCLFAAKCIKSNYLNSLNLVSKLLQLCWMNAVPRVFVM